MLAVMTRYRAIFTTEISDEILRNRNMRRNIAASVCFVQYCHTSAGYHDRSELCQAGGQTNSQL